MQNTIEDHYVFLFFVVGVCCGEFPAGLFTNYQRFNSIISMRLPAEHSIIFVSVGSTQQQILLIAGFAVLKKRSGKNTGPAEWRAPRRDLAAEESTYSSACNTSRSVQHHGGISRQWKSIGAQGSPTHH